MSKTIKASAILRGLKSFAPDAKVQTGIENPDLGVYLMDAITPLSRFGQPVICSERSLP